MERGTTGGALKETPEEKARGGKKILGSGVRERKE